MHLSHRLVSNIISRNTYYNFPNTNEAYYKYEVWILFWKLYLTFSKFAYFNIRIITSLYYSYVIIIIIFIMRRKTFVPKFYV